MPPHTPSSGFHMMHPEHIDPLGQPSGADKMSIEYVLDEMRRSSKSRHDWQTQVSSVMAGMQVEIMSIIARQDAEKAAQTNYASLAESVRTMQQSLAGAFGQDGIVRDVAAIRELTSDIRHEQMAIKSQLSKYADDQSDIIKTVRNHTTVLESHKVGLDQSRRTTTDHIRLASTVKSLAESKTVRATPEAWWLTQGKQHALTAVMGILLAALAFGFVPAVRQFMGLGNDRYDHTLPQSVPAKAGP